MFLTSNILASYDPAAATNYLLAFKSIYEKLLLLEEALLYEQYATGLSP